MHPKIIVPILIAALIALRVYLRMRRSFGRQRVRARRMTVRIAIFAVLAIGLVGFSGAEVWTMGAVLAGAACGAVLGYLALRYTRFESTAEGRFYTPHTYIGLAVTVLFLARIAYDVLVMYHSMPLATAGNPHTPPLPTESPTTLAVSGAFIAYYLSYYLGVLRKSRQPAGMSAGIQTTPE